MNNPRKCELCPQPAMEGDILCKVDARLHDDDPPPSEVLRTHVSEDGFLKTYFTSSLGEARR